MRYFVVSTSFLVCLAALSSHCTSASKAAGNGGGTEGAVDTAAASKDDLVGGHSAGLGRSDAPPSGRDATTRFAAVSAVGVSTGSGSTGGASSDAQAAGRGLPCGSAGSCDPSSAYCSVTMGGAMPVHGAPSVVYACRALPSSCATGLACACLKGSSSCQCVQRGGGLTMTCALP